MATSVPSQESNPNITADFLRCRIHYFATVKCWTNVLSTQTMHCLNKHCMTFCLILYCSFLNLALMIIVMTGCQLMSGLCAWFNSLKATPLVNGDLHDPSIKTIYPNETFIRPECVHLISHNPSVHSWDNFTLFAIIVAFPPSFIVVNIFC